MTVPCIAIVDDDYPYIALLDDLLQEEGYTTLCCVHGVDAFHRIRAAQPALVILDMRMEQPDSGMQVLELLRLDRATKDIPVVFCSADIHFLRAKRAHLERYHCQVLEKPFELDELLACIQRLLGGMYHEAGA